MVYLPVQSLMLALATPLANHGVAVNHFNLGARALEPLGGGVPLRVLPLGASITYGQGSSDANGYRESLRVMLTSAGNQVNMVGSRKSGSMPDNDVEGWPGKRIGEVAAEAKKITPKTKPNVVLINAGTNDALQNFQVSTASARMEAMIVDLFAMSPKATVVLSTLIMNRVADVETRVLDINAQYRQLARKLRRQGRRVVLAEMHGSDGLVSSDMVDDTHPNDVGYKKMASIWFRALVAASDEKLLQRAEAVSGLPDGGP
ncbi:family 3 putative carbohydrate esterase [Cladorrhinum samala]|uniref:Family 3 putative carbohydrate esterase n=1 Tax=Cladorrhinum samala TaxID=585594 RepID=A0AAV9HXS0_9PEZI|nr:family 3 putative carbohydrate esterase [Cladorrhinum samala]